jgi:hypothetical protein
MRFWPVTSTKNKGGGGRPSNEEGLRFDFLLQKKNKIKLSRRRRRHHLIFIGLVNL